METNLQIRRTYPDNWKSIVFCRVSIYKILIPSFLLEESELEYSKKTSLEKKFIGFKPFVFCKIPTIVSDTALNSYHSDIEFLFPYTHLNIQHGENEFVIHLMDDKYYTETELDSFFIRKIKLNSSKISRIIDYHYDGYYKPKEFIDKIRQLANKYFQIDKSSVIELRILKDINLWIEQREKELKDLLINDIEKQELTNSKSIKQIDTNTNNVNDTPQNIKLQFRNQKGDRIALYHVFRELSKRKIIPKNDWKHIAEFIIQNIESFEKDDIEYIAKELSRDYNSPKEKNKIDLNEFDTD